MFQSFILRRLDRLEQDLGASMEYLRHMARVAMPALFRFSSFRKVAEYRRKLPLEVIQVARIATMQSEDCGSCLQISINEARRAGVSRETIRALVNERYDAVDPALADVARFASAVSMPSGDDPELREKLRQRYGEEAFVELCLAIATARVFPSLKRGLGYATSCSTAPVDVA